MPFGAKTEAVTVRGQQATLITGTADQKGTLLRWQENGVTIIIAGTLSREQALAIAATLNVELGDAVPGARAARPPAPAAGDRSSRF